LIFLRYRPNGIVVRQKASFDVQAEKLLGIYTVSFQREKFDRYILRPK